MKHHSIRVTAQCAFTNATNGKRCNAQTTITHPYCWRHTQKVLGVTVRKSAIPFAGLGLFATRMFSIGDAIVEYRGKRMSMRAYNAKYEHELHGAYGMQLNRSTVLDAAETAWGVARYACDYHGSGKKNNAEFVNENGRIWIIAIWPIKPHQEILVDYGEEMHEAMGIK
jgi:uncharacterized protein